MIQTKRLLGRRRRMPVRGNKITMTAQEDKMEKD
jgi:hypothetical protein